MSTLEWRYTDEDLTDPIEDLVSTNCMMPSCEQWRCAIALEEQKHVENLHMYDGEPYPPMWANEKVCMRGTGEIPPQSRRLDGQ